MSAWLIWLVVAAALAIAETLSLDLVLAMCASGALAASLSAALGAPSLVQLVIAIVVASAMVLLVRPVAKRHLVSASHPTGVEALVGSKAVVLTVVDSDAGLVRLNGGDWSARAFDERQVIQAGETVQVMKISGATALVWVPPQHDSLNSGGTA